MTVVDAHLHVWDLERCDYPWLGPQHGPLHRSFLPDEAGRELTTADVRTAVLVQAADSLADTRWLLDVAQRHDWVHGVVGWVALDDPGSARDQLDELAGPALRGIRHLVHDDPRADFLDLSEVRRSLGLLVERGLPLDVPDAWPTHLDAVARLAGDLPELVVVVDHLGKPPRGGDHDELAAWERSLRAVAAHPSTVAKLSGLQQPGQPLTAAALRPVFDVALDAFGPHRLMYGGDWPMTVGVGGYAAVHEATRALVDTLAPDERAAIWRGTATRTYGRELHG
ncbi:amidohydrolase [Nocardioides sp. SYSU D00038]|uniref:amidohydrolase family protein n=1 Tax=Nocardioides sp. SYSU D00038 TaxID=2812554 RepID=UPI00196838A2|nr:amidohydrolase family protein [Nocardioides sp. SYSU D00038]